MHHLRDLLILWYPNEARNPVPIGHHLLVALLQVSCLISGLRCEQLDSDPLIFDLNGRLFLHVSPLHRKALGVCSIFHLLDIHHQLLARSHVDLPGIHNPLQNLDVLFVDFKLLDLLLELTRGLFGTSICVVTKLTGRSELRRNWCPLQAFNAAVLVETTVLNFVDSLMVSF